MPIATRARLGSYEKLEPLGAGGMGEELQSPVFDRQSPVVDWADG